MFTYWTLIGNALVDQALWSGITDRVIRPVSSTTHADLEQLQDLLTDCYSFRLCRWEVADANRLFYKLNESPEAHRAIQTLRNQWDPAPGYEEFFALLGLLCIDEVYLRRFTDVLEIYREKGEPAALKALRGIFCSPPRFDIGEISELIQVLRLVTNEDFATSVKTIGTEGWVIDIPNDGMQRVVCDTGVTTSRGYRVYDSVLLRFLADQNKALQEAFASPEAATERAAEITVVNPLARSKG